MSENKKFKDRLKALGVEIYTQAKKEYEAVVKSTNSQIKKEKLRKRFNLENPHRFVLLDSKTRVKLFDNIFARHAKKYDEDDIFVFYGSKSFNSFEKGQKIKDLSDNVVYEILEIVEVTIPVSLDENVFDVECSAIYGKAL